MAIHKIPTKLLWKSGDLEIMKWLHDNNVKGCTIAMDCAALKGQLNTVKWLHENRTEGSTNNAMNLAA